jgi:hypothetical protein
MQPSNSGTPVPPAIVVHPSPPQYQTRDFRLDPIVATDGKYCPSTKTKFRVLHKPLSPHLKFERVELRRKSLGGSVGGGVLVFRCDGKVFSLKDKKVLIDVESGNVILNIKKELLTLAQVYSVYNKVHHKDIT